MVKKTNPLSIIKEKIGQAREAKRHLDMAKEDMFEVKGQEPKRQVEYDRAVERLESYIDSLVLSNEIIK